MKLQAKAGQQFATYDDANAGEGLSIFLSQSASDVVRWRFDVYAILNHGELLVGSFCSSPPVATTPIGPPTRMVAGAVCPGATSWKVVVYAADGWQSAPQETAGLTLGSSKCCTAHIGVSRVGERFVYVANDSSVQGTYDVLAGQKIVSVTAIASKAADAQVTIGTAGPGIIVPNTFQVTIPVNKELPIKETISFNHCIWIVELLESA